jgi:hypothetical protein
VVTWHYVRVSFTAIHSDVGFKTLPPAFETSAQAQSHSNPSKLSDSQLVYNQHRSSLTLSLSTMSTPNTTTYPPPTAPEKAPRRSFFGNRKTQNEANIAQNNMMGEQGYSDNEYQQQRGFTHGFSFGRWARLVSFFDPWYQLINLDYMSLIC